MTSNWYIGHPANDSSYIIISINHFVRFWNALSNVLPFIANSVNLNIVFHWKISFHRDSVFFVVPPMLKRVIEEEYAEISPPISKHLDQDLILEANGWLVASRIALGPHPMPISIAHFHSRLGLHSTRTSSNRVELVLGSLLLPTWCLFCLSHDLLSPSLPAFPVTRSPRWESQMFIKIRPHTGLLQSNHVL